MSNSSLNKRPISVERLVNECEPEKNSIDARILYEMTGKKQCKTDYLDESSFELDEFIEEDLEASDEIEYAFRSIETPYVAHVPTVSQYSATQVTAG